MRALAADPDTAGWRRRRRGKQDGTRRNRTGTGLAGVASAPDGEHKRQKKKQVQRGHGDGNRPNRGFSGERSEVRCKPG
jgi:hypothetical protein